MGSFNTRCFASQQTIVPGAVARIIPIIRQSTYSPVDVCAHDNVNVISSISGASHSTCYSDAFWSIYSPLLQGEYSDYGRFTLFDIPENTHYLQILFNKLYQESLITKQGENEYHEKAFNMRELYDPKKKYSFDELQVIFDNVWELASNYRIFMQNHRGVQNTAFAVVSEVAFQEMVRMYESLKSYSGESYGRQPMFEREFAPFFKALEELESMDQAMRLHFMLDRPFRERNEAHTSLGYSYGVDIFDDNIQKTIKEYLEHRDINVVKAFFFNAYMPFYEIKGFLFGLENFELKVQPMIYAGQDYHNAIGKNYASFVQRVSAQICANIDYEDDDLEDDLEDDDPDALNM